MKINVGADGIIIGVAVLLGIYGASQAHIDPLIMLIAVGALLLIWFGGRQALKIRW